MNVLFGYDDKELLEKELELLIPTKYHKGHGKHFNSFMKSSSNRQMGQGRELYGRKKDGSEFPVEVGLNPFKIYGNTYVMALVVDITLRKEQEQQIRELNEELEKKIEVRTAELKKSVEDLEKEVERRKNAENKMKESLRKERELNELKTKFLSLVSHEFKTPLSGISTSATLISKYTAKEQQDKRDKHIKTIQSKVKFLNNILDDFLSIEHQLVIYYLLFY